MTPEFDACDKWLEEPCVLEALLGHAMNDGRTFLCDDCLSKEDRYVLKSYYAFARRSIAFDKVVAIDPLENEEEADRAYFWVAGWVKAMRKYQALARGREVW